MIKIARDWHMKEKEVKIKEKADICKDRELERQNWGNSGIAG